MWALIKSWMGWLLAATGVGFMIGRELSKLREDVADEKRRKAEIERDMAIARDRARRDLSGISNEELIRRAASGRDPKTGDEADEK